MALEIEFIDGPPHPEVGETAQIRVVQEFANGNRAPVELRHVVFSFTPFEWGEVHATDDPLVGRIEVTRVAEEDDLLEEPEYGLAATLAAKTGQKLRSTREIRLQAAALEVELSFEVRRAGVRKWRPFTAEELRQPMDWSLARVSDPERHSLVIRDGIPYLRIAPPAALPCTVAITFPNGATASLTIGGALHAWQPGEEPGAAPPPAPAPEPAAAPAPAPGPPRTLADIEDTDGLALPEAIDRMRRYVHSFFGATGRADPVTLERVQERVAREVRKVWARLQRHEGDDRRDLIQRFQLATEGTPEARKAAQALLQGEAGA